MSRLASAGLLLIPLLAALPLRARPPDSIVLKPDRDVQAVMVTDGSPVHATGNLRVHASNWGAIGSMPGSGMTFSGAPSAEWPAGSGIEYLFVAGLWVGALVGGVPAVSTSAFDMEFRPLADTRDTVYHTATGAEHGARIPFDPDDDFDGAANEDPLDGYDNDLDGAIDEDYAAVSDQMLVRRFRDDVPGITDIYPAHVPMHLEVREESCSFAETGYDDFVGFTFSITNTGDAVLHDVYIGLLADGDVGARGQPNYWEDDATGWAQVQVNLGAHGTRTVSFPCWRDADGDGGDAGGRCGFVLLDHTVDPEGVTAPDSVAIRSWRVFRDPASYEEGGTPTNDFERYEAMSSGTMDRPLQLGDVRALMSVGPFPTVSPGQTIAFTIALVVTPDDFSNVARAVEAYHGRWFDLDHDPATGIDGQEHHEPWFLPSDQPAPIWIARFEAAPDGGSVKLRWLVVGDQDVHSVDVWRAPANGGQGELIATVPGSEHEYTDVPADGAKYSYRIIVRGEFGAVISSPSLEVNVPDLGTTFWQAYPNPFRDATTISAHLAERAGIELTVFDLAGRRVATLASGTRDAGEVNVTWNGIDDNGRRCPSGVYFCRLEVGGQTFSQKILIMR